MRGALLERVMRNTAITVFIFALIATRAHGEGQAATGTQQAGVAQNIITCESKAGTRTSCPADTSSGVVLVRSTGESPCLLGKTWGYDNTSIWVSDGCSGQFFAGQIAQP